jgi:hypothetical protein
MKISTLSLAVAATICAATVGAGQALAIRAHQAAPKTLNVVMRDPGCHWFKIAGKYKTKAAFTGRVKLVNFDEDTLKVASRQGIKRIAVGKSLVVSRGHYVITMVGQAADDNHLKLTVR